MWPSNALTERLNLKWPIIQAPMGSASTPALAAAVSNAGGLGGLGMWGRTAEQAARRIAGFRKQSGCSLNVNYPIWPDPRCPPEITEAMQRQLQPRYDTHGLDWSRSRKAPSATSGPHMWRCCSKPSSRS
jgi:nitronate monooxygenase